jgi:fructose-bisphosphate aldolase class II
MGLVTLKEILNDADQRKYGVGLFNTINLEMVRAIIGAAEEERSPVIIGLAEVHIPYGALETLAPIMVKAAKEASVPVAVHFDHGMTFDLIVKAMHLGFSSVMYDGSTLPYEENISNTAEIVKIAKALGVSVEAELGHVGGNEGGEDDGKEAHYTNIDQALDFVSRTDIDALAVAIGTAHGVYHAKPKLDLERLEAIKSKVNIPLVLHGGSGLSEDDFRNSIQKGISKVNIFTDMSLAAVNTLRNTIQNANETNSKLNYPDLINITVDGIKMEIISKMRLFGSSNRV